MPKIIICGDNPMTKRALCWVGVDGSEYKVPYKGGDPSVIDLSVGAHDVYVTTESRISRNMNVNDGSISGGLASYSTQSTNAYEQYQIDIYEGGILYIYVQNTMKPKIYAKMTTEEQYNSDVAEIDKMVTAANSATGKKITGFLMFLLSFIPFVGIVVGIVQFCRKDKRIALGILCIIVNLFVITGAGTSLYGSGGSPAYLPATGTTSVVTTSDTTQYTESTTLSNDDETSGAYSVKYIVAEGGLNLRDGPGTEKSVLVVMDNAAPVKVYREENGWSYVEYNGQFGWCSSEFLAVEQTTSAVTETDRTQELTPESNDVYLSKATIDKAINDANAVIDSFRGKDCGGMTSATEDSILSLFKEAERVNSETRNWICGVIGNYLGDVTSDTGFIMFAHVDKSKFNSVEDVARYYYSLYSDDIAAEMLKDNIFSVDGELYAFSGAKGDDGVERENAYDVTKINDERYEITVTTTEFCQEPPTVSTRICPLIFEDGNWVLAVA